MESLEVSDPRRIFTWRRLAALMAAMFLWGMVAAPSSQSEEVQVVEPSDVVAYSTVADARPVQTYFDHQTYQIPIGPSLAHSQTEVSMPSQASGVAWLVDAGLANGLHGTTTGNRVPTEANAKQPGGAPSAEFKVAGGPIGDDNFGKVGAGTAGAKAERDDTPRGYAFSHFENLVILPAAGNPEQPPGTFNPENTFPGGKEGKPTPDPQPQGQMAIMSIGSIASTAESVRNGSSVTSIAVAELKEINIGNRTSDNRCTNCIRIDGIRAEAFAEANGQPGGARGRYRVIVGRVCRRALDTGTSTRPSNREVDTCIQPSEASNQLPQDVTNQRVVGATDESERIDRFEELNEMFERPIWYTLTDGDVSYAIGIRLHAGTPHDDPDRAQRTSNPKEDPRRNYGYPDDRLDRACERDLDCEDKHPDDQPVLPKDQEAPDQDNGTVAKAVAEALDVEITTLTLAQAAPSDQDIGARTDELTKNLPEDQRDAIRGIDEDRNTPGIQITVPEPDCDDAKCLPPVGAQVGPNQIQAWPIGRQTVGVDQLRTMRRINLTFGVAAVNTTVRPSTGPGVIGGDPGGTGNGGGPAPTGPGPITVPGGDTGPPTAIPGGDAGPGTVVVSGGLKGPLKVKLNWAKFRLRPWSPGDQAKGFLSGGIIAGAWVLAKRRLRLLS